MASHATFAAFLLSAALNVYMPRCLVLLLPLLFLLACQKTGSEPDTILTELSIVATATTVYINQGQDIVSRVRCSGPNFCYSFAKFEIRETVQGQFEISAKAHYPNPKKGDIICLQAVYYIDTVLRIKNQARGQYLLKFINNQQLFKTDTVRVN